MTDEEKIAFLKAIPKTTISPAQFAVVAGGNPYTYNVMAKEGKLDQQAVPHFWRGRNLRIWKAPVIRMIGGQA